MEVSRAAAFGLLLRITDRELAARYLFTHCLYPVGVMVDAVTREIRLGVTEPELRQRIQGYTAAIERDTP